MSSATSGDSHQVSGSQRDFHLSSSSVDRFLLEHGLDISSSSFAREEKESTMHSIASNAPSEKQDQPLSLHDFAPLNENLQQSMQSASISQVHGLNMDQPRSSVSSSSSDLESSSKSSIRTSNRTQSPLSKLFSFENESGSRPSPSTMSSERRRRSTTQADSISVSRNPNDSSMKAEELSHDLHESTTTSENARNDEWTTLNSLLLQHGFPCVDMVSSPIGMLPEKTSLINIVHDLISQLERQSQTVQDLIQESTINSKQQQRTEANLAASEKKLQEMRQSLDNAQREIESFKVDIKEVKVKFESDVKSLKNQKVKLEQQLKISEHRVKAKETLLERLQNKLQQQIDKEEFSKSRNQDVFRKIQQREPRKTSPSDLKSIELIGMYENERSHLNDEIAQLRNQVQELCSEVREKENIISRASGGGINIKDHDSLLHRLEQARFEQEQVTQQLRLQERSIHEKMRNIEAELHQSKQVIQELREENSNLHLEVEARPTIRDYKATQRRALLLERQLSSQTLAMKEANNIEELRKYIGTAELIRRDKTNAKLQLNRLNALPKDTCVEIIQDVCRQLELTDITLIGPSIAKMISVVQAIPRLEKFVRDVCTIAASKPASSLESVLHTLSRWKQDIGNFNTLKKYATDSFHLLASRREKSFQPVESATVYSQALRAIEELVVFESQFLEEQNMYQLAAENVQKQPNLLVNRMVQHFRHLFGVKTMDGVFPKINEVFLFVNEMNNALSSIKTTLGLAQDVSVSNALIALKDHLESVRPRPMPRQTENYVVAKNEEVAGLAQVRQNHMILKELKHVLGAQTFEELVPRAQRLMELLSISIQNTTN